MQYIIAYDITENDVRTAIADLLIAKGFLRLQKSVFIGDASKPKLKELQIRLKEISMGSTGVINIFSQCTKCIGRQIEIIPEEQETEPEREEQTEKEEQTQSKPDTEITKKPFPSMPVEFLTPLDLSSHYQNADLSIRISLVNPLKKKRGKPRIKKKVIEIRTGVFLSDLC